MAIIGGAGWTAATASAWDKLACDWGIPTCADFRRQDAIPNGNSSYVGNLGYGANPALVKRLRSEEQTSELQSLLRISYDDLCLIKNKIISQSANQSPYTYTFDIND